MAGITTGADGSIHISTKIDESGVNVGTKNIGKTIEKNIARPMQNLTKSLGGILKVIKSIGAALVAAFVGGAIINGIRGIVQEFDLLTGTSGDKFKALSGALDTLKGAFVNLLVQAILPFLPAITDFINKITEGVQWVTQLVAALFGFDKTVGGIMTKAASGAQKAAKAAKGALAAFDQINVLQKKETPETPEGATATPAPIPVLDDILKKVADLKKLWDEFLKDPLGVLFRILKAVIEDLSALWMRFIQWVRDNVPFGDVIADILIIIGNTLKKVFINFVETFLKIKENFIRVMEGIWNFITGVFTGDWALAWQGLVDIVGGIWGGLSALVEGILNHIAIVLGGMAQILQVLFAPVIEFLGKMFEKIKEKIVTAILSIQGTFGSLAKWFAESVFNPIANGFGSMLTDIKQGFEKTFNGIKDFVRGVMNSIIDFLNRMIEGVVSGINAVIGAANAVAGLAGLPEISSVTAPKIPRLATGAVVPAHANMLAMIGEGSKTEIVSPVDLMRQTFEESLSRALANQTITINFTGSAAEIARMLKPAIDRENNRIGQSLVKSGVIR